MATSELKAFEPALSHCRSTIPILIVDDSDFPHFSALKSLGFQIVWRKDIDALADAAPYPIVASDITGVGASMGSDGAFVIDQLKRHYPTKYVIAFSSGTYDMRYQAALSQADARVLKSADIETWSHELDRGLTHLCSPLLVWRRAAHRLAEADVPYNKISFLKKSFIRGLKNGHPLTELEIKSALDIKSNELWSKLSHHVRELVGFGANALTIVRTVLPE